MTEWSYSGAGDITAALEYAETHELADIIDIGDGYVLVRQRGGECWERHDTLPADHPRRPRGTVHVHDADSFARAIAMRGSGPVYADEEHLALVGILNDDKASDGPGWRDYRVSLQLRPTPEWAAWKDGQGLGEQKRFAERIEDGLPEITRPDGAEMLELAQTFHASVGVQFQSGSRLASGETQFAYLEDVKASAGTKPGTITIPDTFEIAVRPFIGADRWSVTARLRFRLRSGDLSIGYQLVRPGDIERDAFGALVEQARTAMAGTEFLAGPAPSPAN